MFLAYLLHLFKSIFIPTKSCISHHIVPSNTSSTILFNNPTWLCPTLLIASSISFSLLPEDVLRRYLHCMLEISANASSFYYLLMEVLYSSENISGCIIVLGCHQVRYQNPAVTALFYIPLGWTVQDAFLVKISEARPEKGSVFRLTS